MFPKLVFLAILIPLLAACLSPSGGAAPAQQTSEVSETSEVSTLPPTETSAPTETLAPTPEPTATPEAETVTFLRSGVEEVTMLKKDTITLDLSNGETMIMPKIQAGSPEGLIKKGFEFIISDGITRGTIRQPDRNYKPNDPNDPYSKFINDFLLIKGLQLHGLGAVVPNDETIPASERFRIGLYNVDQNKNKGVILSYESDDPKPYAMVIFLVNATAEEIKSLLESGEIEIPSKPE